MKGFKDIPGYEGLYAVSRDGKVFSYHYGKVLTPKRSSIGYLRVTLCNGINNHKTVGIHRLVAMTYIPNPDSKPTVNHINEVKTDNRVENLEWATTAEQNSHGTRTARAMANTDWEARTRKIDYRAVAVKHDYQQQHMCNRKVTEVFKDGNFVGAFRSQREAADYAKISISRVSMCVSGQIESVKGFSFRRREYL